MPSVNTKALLIACILIMCTLSFIQYDLVRNTYILTKNNYYAEIRQAVSAVTGEPKMLALEAKARENLRFTVTDVINAKLTKADFAKVLAQRNQEINKACTAYLFKALGQYQKSIGTQYKFQFDEICYEVNGKIDTLLRNTQTPIIFVGEKFDTPNTIFLHKNLTVSNDSNLKIFIKESNYIDLSIWRREVLKRMGSILCLAVGLIVAVSLMFYLVFRAMIKQKKIADIKTDFANNITHELKTPLSSVGIIIKGLERTDIQTNPQLFNDHLQSLNRQYKKIQHVVDSVLESAMANSLHIDLQQTDITAYLREYIADFKVTTHQLDISIQEQSVWISTHLPTLEKALNMLMENAVKYTPESSTIGLKAYIDQNSYMIEIADSGPGISASHQSQLFDKFYRVPEQNRHTVKGLGLGLYIAKQAITQLGGHISLKSAIGKGTTFTINLPIHED